MNVGKYSHVCPNVCPHINVNDDYYRFNSYGKEPIVFNGKDKYDIKTMFPNYDREGFDSYGYSCFNAEGEYMGIGEGIDRAGKTEQDYLIKSLGADVTEYEGEYGYEYTMAQPE